MFCYVMNCSICASFEVTWPSNINSDFSELSTPPNSQTVKVLLYRKILKTPLTRRGDEFNDDKEKETSVLLCERCTQSVVDRVMKSSTQLTNKSQQEFEVSENKFNGTPSYEQIPTLICSLLDVTSNGVSKNLQIAITTPHTSQSIKFGVDDLINATKPEPTVEHSLMEYEGSWTNEEPAEQICVNEKYFLNGSEEVEWPEFFLDAFESQDAYENPFIHPAMPNPLGNEMPHTNSGNGPMPTPIYPSSSYATLSTTVEQTPLLPQKTYTCLLCREDMSFKYKRGLAFHYSDFHRNPKVFPCFVCGKRFDDKQKLYQHRRNVHKNLHKNRVWLYVSPKGRSVLCV